MLRAETGERAAEVALDVVVERLQGRDVEDTKPVPALEESRSIAERKAVSVFPDPVGAWINTSEPVAIAGQPSRWAGVGPANALANQARVAGEKASRQRFRQVTAARSANKCPRI